MACDNCQGVQGWYCPICAPTTPAKPAVCEVCHDPTCPCGKVVLRTDAELIDALRACREKLRAKWWSLSGALAELTERDKVMSDQIAHLQAAKDAEIARLRACIAEIRVDADTTLTLRDESRTLLLMSMQAADTLAIIAKHGVGNV